jgi:hypothetical protein
LTLAQNLAEICYKTLQNAIFPAVDVRKWWKFSNFTTKTKNGRHVESNIEGKKGAIVMYQPDETIRLEVRMEGETVWLNQAQMGELFGTGRQAITKHLQNIYDSAELNKDATCSILELVRQEGKRMVKRKMPVARTHACVYCLKGKRRDPSDPSAHKRQGAEGAEGSHKKTVRQYTYARNTATLCSGSPAQFAQSDWSCA